MFLYNDYIGSYIEYYRRDIMCRLRDTMSTSGKVGERGCSICQRNTIIQVRKYHEHIAGSSVNQSDIIRTPAGTMVHVRSIMSTSGST